MCRISTFYYRKMGEGGGQKVMIGIIISDNVDNYGRPLNTLLSDKVNFTLFLIDYNFNTVA